MPITYQKIDETKVKKIVSTESELAVADLEVEIADLKSRIAALPQAKTKADQETLDFWNLMNPDLAFKSALETDVAKKEAELDKINAVLQAKAVQGMKL